MACCSPVLAVPDGSAMTASRKLPCPTSAATLILGRAFSNASKYVAMSGKSGALPNRVKAAA